MHGEIPSAGPEPGPVALEGLPKVASYGSVREIGFRPLARV
jgi:hypothetical protein